MLDPIGSSLLKRRYDSDEENEEMRNFIEENMARDMKERQLDEIGDGLFGRQTGGLYRGHGGRYRYLHRP